MNEGRIYIENLRTRWRYFHWISILVNAVAISIVTGGMLLILLPGSSWLLIPVFLITVSFLMWFNKPWRMTPYEVSRYLNIHYPQLEESSELFLENPERLNLLQRFQAERVATRISSLEQPTPYKRKLVQSFLFLVASLLVSFLLAFLLPDFIDSSDKSTISTTRNLTKEKPIPGITNVIIEITPPAYTGRKPRRQSQFNLEVEEGASIKWNINANKAVSTVSMIFNDKDSIKLNRSSNDDHTYSRVIKNSGYYQLQLNDVASDLFQINVIKDKAPLVAITSPSPTLTIQLGKEPVFQLRSQLSDDYGITKVNISATVARGKGEGVKFFEKQLSFATFSPGKIGYQLGRTIDLRELEMVPGDELYYYITATDNLGQQSRTDVYIVSLPDTSDLMSLEGLVSGVNLVPEYFRSQRQIIIDAERLLREKDTITREHFNSRSNNLGIDQKLLRLRYGKFLGEESETTIGEDPSSHEHEEEEHEETPFGDAKKLLEEYGHSHDNAEDATFFEPELKAQLKATLNEMWTSELKLRMYSPREALPYAYKALRLLKDLQQKSRVYVGKTGFNPTPLKNDKRLTGELDKVTEPRRELKYNDNDKMLHELRYAISILDLLKRGTERNSAHLPLLRRANDALSKKAIDQPATYLKSASSIRNIINNFEDGGYSTRDIEVVIAGLYRLVESPGIVPQPGQTKSTSRLSDAYFLKLKSGR